MLLFPTTSALKEIYWDPKLNTKSGLYGSGLLGPPGLFTTLRGDVHKSLRKALSGPQVRNKTLCDTVDIAVELNQKTLVDNRVIEKGMGASNRRSSATLDTKVDCKIEAKRECHSFGQGCVRLTLTPSLHLANTNLSQRVCC